eukprot:2726670-Rhodomonas_salina.2
MTDSMKIAADPHAARRREVLSHVDARAMHWKPRPANRTAYACTRRLQTASCKLQAAPGVQRQRELGTHTGAMCSR